MKPCLVVVDTTQIQSYIFASNRLAENIGASWLVKQATGAWALETIMQVASKHNIADPARGQLDPQRCIERDNLEAEVIYATGGNVLVLFKDETLARQFVRQHSRRVLASAPGLTLLFSIQCFDWAAAPEHVFDWSAHPDGSGFNPERHGGGLYLAVQHAFADLDRQKANRPFDAPLLGLGVTAACRSTGLPATHILSYGEDRNLPLSSSVVAKLRAAPLATDELCEQFRAAIAGDFDFPSDLDQLGRTRGEQSFIAVVHIDGNGFGEAMRRLGQRYAHDNRTYIDALRKRSRALQDAAETTLTEMLNSLTNFVHRVEQARKQGKHLWPVEPPELVLADDNRKYLPFRPLIIGGDDVTFVCDARLALSLTTRYLTLFADRAAEALCKAGALLPDEQPSACAGVAVVKSRFPFARAYQLADELCRNAKRARARAQDTTNQPQGAYLDWHIAISGLIDDLSAMRRREYRTPHGELTLRPVRLTQPKDGTSLTAETARTWTIVERLTRAFQESNWAQRRNKVKALREALRQGPNAVERFVAIYGDAELPELAEGDKGKHRRTGWLDSSSNGSLARCAYFDAVELMDLHLPIEHFDLETLDLQPEPEEA